MSVIIFKYEMNLLKNDNKILFYSYNLGLKIIIYSIKKISLGRGEKSQFYYVIKNNIKNIRDFCKIIYINIIMRILIYCIILLFII
ncbi:hypothetical protein PFAG_00005 [Plasmodium falciparum Santa Lucia]|uniref:Uncharacterized protein n=2 Tax=Plasmodium falciparum TaxID=5833 RepID=A0A024VEI6_PLAFA|nr:hypothetical protein PFFVO_00013 [Plasmodium falciparum Vietnam Oak-Knoll (FVO)]EUT94343.1 hypothetical protein PFAG_00005 [Plasmodium falciparum Santa Lucia]